MGRKSRNPNPLALALLSIGVTLGAWAYIIARQPTGMFHQQGGMMITILIFPLTFLVWAIGGMAAISWGSRALGEAGRGRRAPIAAIVLGVVGLVLSFGTCVVPEVIAHALFWQPL